MNTERKKPNERRMKPTRALTGSNVLRCNNLEVRVNGAKIYGNCNKVVGSRNVVLGSYNVVEGLGNTLIGLDNTQVSPPESDRDRENGGEVSGTSRGRRSGRENRHKRRRAERDVEGKGEGGEGGGEGGEGGEGGGLGGWGRDEERGSTPTAMDVVDLASPRIVDLTSPRSEIRDRRVREQRQRSQIESDHRMAMRLSHDGMSDVRSLIRTPGGLMGIFGATSQLETMERDGLTMTSYNPVSAFRWQANLSNAVSHSASSSSSSSSSSGSGSKPLSPSDKQVAKEKDAKKEKRKLSKEKDASVPEGDREETFCSICKVRPRTSMALPCQHVAFCAKCGKKSVEIHNLKECPICREDMSAGVIVKEDWDKK